MLVWTQVLKALRDAHGRLGTPIKSFISPLFLKSESLFRKIVRNVGSVRIVTMVESKKIQLVRRISFVDWIGWIIL